MPATFPSLPINPNTSLGHDTGLVMERSSSGALRGRAFYTARKTNFKLSLELLTRAQVYGTATASLIGFYDAWHAGDTPFLTPLEPFTLTIDSISYSCVFLTPPSVTYRGYNSYDCIAELIEA